MRALRPLSRPGPGKGIAAAAGLLLLGATMLGGALARDHSAALAGRTALEPGNLLAASRGARVVHRTSELPTHPASSLVQDDGSPGRRGWISSEGVLPQGVTFDLGRNLPFDTVEIDPAADPDPATWPRVVEVVTADPYPHMGGWKEVVRARLAPEAGPKRFTFTRIRGRFLRVNVTEAGSPDAPRVGIRSIRLYLSSDRGPASSP